jgi:predicted nucleotidyltransferase
MNRTKQLVLQGVGGSHAAGLATATSDTDTFQVYVHPLPYYLGARLTNDRPAQKVDSGQDVTAYEFRHFVGQCAKGNPTPLRLLFLNQYDHLSGAGVRLVDNRKLFLSKACIDPFLGAAHSYMQRAKNATDGNDASNAMLLVWQLWDVLQYGHLPIKMHEYVTDFLREVRAGRVTWNDIEKQYNFMLEWAGNVAVSTTLPDQPDMDAINLLCTECVLHPDHN